MTSPNHQPWGATHWRSYQHDGPSGYLDGDDGSMWHMETHHVYFIPQREERDTSKRRVSTFFADSF